METIQDLVNLDLNKHEDLSPNPRMYKVLGATVLVHDTTVLVGRRQDSYQGLLVDFIDVNWDAFRRHRQTQRTEGWSKLLGYTHCAHRVVEFILFCLMQTSCLGDLHI